MEYYVIYIMNGILRNINDTISINCAEFRNHRFAYDIDVNTETQEGLQELTADNSPGLLNGTNLL